MPGKNFPLLYLISKVDSYQQAQSSDVLVEGRRRARKIDASSYSQGPPYFTLVNSWRHLYLRILYMHFFFKAYMHMLM